MAVYKDAAGVCHKLAGPDMQADTKYDLDDPNNKNGLKINYKGGDTSYNFSIEMKCIS